MLCHWSRCHTGSKILRSRRWHWWRGMESTGCSSRSWIGKMTVWNEETTSVAYRDETSKERKEEKAASVKKKGGWLRLVGSISLKWLVVSFLSGNLNISLAVPLLRRSWIAQNYSHTPNGRCKEFAVVVSYWSSLSEMSVLLPGTC